MLIWVYCYTFNASCLITTHAKCQSLAIEYIHLFIWYYEKLRDHEHLAIILAYAEKIEIHL